MWKYGSMSLPSVRGRLQKAPPGTPIFKHETSWVDWDRTTRHEFNEEKVASGANARKGASKIRAKALAGLGN